MKSPPMVSLLAALSENYVIGSKNSIPWHLPKDLKRFKKLTLGHPVVMGRKTYESIGKALPGRTNILLSRQKDCETPKDCLRAFSLKEALALAREEGEESEIFIIGGGAIYREALLLSDRMYLTWVHSQIEGETFFPTPQWEDWEEVERKLHRADEKHKYDFSFCIYQRK